MFNNINESINNSKMILNISDISGIDNQLNQSSINHSINNISIHNTSIVEIKKNKEQETKMNININILQSLRI